MSHSFRLASYNILADSYVQPQWYLHVDPEILRWDKRRFALAEKLVWLDADILCLQEVEADAYALFEHRLSAQGYAGIYAQKGRGRPDGCATFFKQGLRFAGSETIHYHDRLGAEPDSGHLALLANFTSERGVISMVNTHLRWDKADKPPEEHIGYRQISELLDQHFTPDQSAYAWIICGDFNAESGSAVVNKLASSGFLDAYQGREQPTCNPNRQAKRIDFIFHTAGLLAEPAKLIDIDSATPLPSADEPSDHLAVLASFYLSTN
jgi:mRNA deadenylase 3'-5' endonuclease subunit Ccr4